MKLEDKDFGLSNKLTEIIRKHAPERIEAIENRLGDMPMPINKRTSIILEYLLYPYYQVDANKKAIDEYLESMDEMFSQGFGLFSLRSVYDRKMDELEIMVREMPKLEM